MDGKKKTEQLLQRESHMLKGFYKRLSLAAPEPCGEEPWRILCVKEFEWHLERSDAIWVVPRIPPSQTSGRWNLFFTRNIKLGCVKKWNGQDLIN